jgi:hypothetical protein
LALCFTRLDTRFAHNKGSRPAQANGAATWRFANTYETKRAAGAWSIAHDRYGEAATLSTSTRMHGELLGVLFLQAHRETKAHFTATGMPSQQNISDSFRFKRAEVYQSLKRKVGLAAAKAAAFRINLSRGLWHSSSPSARSISRSGLVYPSRTSERGREGGCVKEGGGSSSLVAHVLHSPPPANTHLLCISRCSHGAG